MKQSYVLGENELEVLVVEFLQNFSNGVVLLQGDLAAGKTTLTKTFAKVLGVGDEVTSPTFSLQQLYGEKLFHYDLYNKGLEHFISLGLLEELEKEGLHLVEWGGHELEEILHSSGIAVSTIVIKKTAFDKREYEVCIH